MSDPYGYYNKYIFNNNSYLKTYLVRETVKNNYRKKNLNSLIDNNLRKNYYPYVKNIKKTNMVDKIDISNIKKIVYKDNYCNTEVNTDFLRIIKDKVSKSKNISDNTVNFNKSFNINNSRAYIHNRMTLNN